MLRIDSESVTVAHDLRENLKSRDFDKIHSVTCVSWGRGEFRRHIALSTLGGQVFLYNIDKQTTVGASKAVLRVQDSNRAVNSITFACTNSNIMLSASGDGSVRLWDLRTTRKKPNLVFAKQGDKAREVQCSPFDGAKFAAIYDSGAIQRWDFRNPSSCDRRINAHSGSGLSLDWHTEYDYIVSGGRDKQIQIWNMASESRKPDHVILSPSPVAKVRWQFDLQRSNASSTYGVLNTNIVSCNMSLYDYGIYVWNPRRPYIPRYTVSSHTNAVTDVFWRSNKSLWSISKDKTFRQHNLADREMTIAQLPAQAISWNHENNLSFVVQDKHEEQYEQVIDEDSLTVPAELKKRQSTTGTRAPLSPVSVPSGPSVNQAVCSVAFPGSDTFGFTFCARHYIFQDTDADSKIQGSSPNNRILDICLHNSFVASHAGKFRWAQTWRILYDIIASEKAQFLKFAPSKQPILGSLQPFASRITESLKGLSSSEGTPMLRPADYSSSNSVIHSRDDSMERSRSRHRVPERSRSRNRALERSRSGTRANDAHDALNKVHGVINNNLSALIPDILPKNDLLDASSNTNLNMGNLAHDILPITEDAVIVSSVSNSESDEKDLVASSLDTSSSPEDQRQHLTDKATGSAFTQLTMKTSNTRGRNRQEESSKTGKSQLADIKEGKVSSNLTSKASSQTNISSLASHSILFESEEIMDLSENFTGKSSFLAPPSASRPVPVNTNSQKERFGGGKFAADKILSPLYSRDSENAFIYLGSDDESPDDLNIHFNKRQIDEPQSSMDSFEEVSKRIEPKISAMTLDPKSSFLPSMNPHDSLAKRYREYVQTLTHPWRAEKMIQHTARYAMEQGDVQMCATLGMLFMRDYPGAFESEQMLEEWIWAYLTSLRKNELHIECAEIIKQSPFSSVRELGQIETSLDLLCHRCSHPLVDNSAVARDHGRTSDNKIAFWYCEHCSKILDGCILCRIPVKGVSVTFFECGHKLHPWCMEEWIEYAKQETQHTTIPGDSLDQSVECPSGCQTIIAN